MAEEKNNEEVETEENDEYFEDENSSSTLVTMLITGSAVALLAPEFLPGMAIGIAAVLAPRFFPLVGNLMRPLVKTAVQAGYSAALTTREAVGEASEQFQDMVAEAQTEHKLVPAHNTRSRHKTTHTARRKAAK